MIALIDADQMVYAAGFATEGEPLSHTLQVIKRKMTEIIDKTEATSYKTFIKGEGNFRDDIAIDYKAHRKSRKPSTYDECRQYLIDEWGADLVDDMEADDMVSILLWHNYFMHDGKKEDCTAVVVTPDKDLNNTPGWHYDPNKESKRFIDNRQALRHFCYQMLCGDTADNIKGLPYACIPHKIRVGRARAKKLLADSVSASEAMDIVTHLYSTWGEAEGIDHEDYMIQQARLLWMLREPTEMFSMDDFYAYTSIP